MIPPVFNRRSADEVGVVPVLVRVYGPMEAAAKGPFSDRIYWGRAYAARPQFCGRFLDDIQDNHTDQEKLAVEIAELSGQALLQAGGAGANCTHRGRRS